MHEITLGRPDFFKLSTEVIRRGGSFQFKAHGRSMTPSIKDGDILVIEAVRTADLHLGDVVFYRSGKERLVAHRLVKRRINDDSKILLIRGDAASSSGEWVQEEQVIGRVVSVQRGKKFTRLDRNRQRSCSFSGEMYLPLERLFFRWLCAVKRPVQWFLPRMQALKPYRILSRNLIGKKISYRPATDSDISKLYGYGVLNQREAPIETVSKQRHPSEGQGIVLAAYFAGRLAGAITARRFPDNEALYPHWWLFGLTVRIRYRGAGIGGTLVKRVVRKVSAYGARKANILVFEHNKPAIRLYTKMGFKRGSIPPLEAEFENEVTQGLQRRIIMVKPL